jgi:hypothetical protein
MEHMHTVSKPTDTILYTEVVAVVGILPTNVFHIPSRHLRKQKVCAKWIAHVLLSIAHFQLWHRERERERERERDTFLHCVLRVNKSWACSFDLKLKQRDVLKVMYIMFTCQRLVLYHPIPPCTMINGAYYVVWGDNVSSSLNQE